MFWVCEFERKKKHFMKKFDYTKPKFLHQTFNYMFGIALTFVLTPLKSFLNL